MTTTYVPRCPVPPAGRTTWLRRSALKKGKHTRKIDFPSFPIFTKSRRVHRTGGHSHANSTVETSSTSKVTLRHRPEKLMGDDPLARGRVRTPRHAPTAAGAPGFPVPRCPLPTSLAWPGYHAEDGGGGDVAPARHGAARNSRDAGRRGHGQEETSRPARPCSRHRHRSPGRERPRRPLTDKRRHTRSAVHTLQCHSAVTGACHRDEA